MSLDTSESTGNAALDRELREKLSPDAQRLLRDLLHPHVTAHGGTSSAAEQGSQHASPVAADGAAGVQGGDPAPGNDAGVVHPSVAPNVAQPVATPAQPMAQPVAHGGPDPSTVVAAEQHLVQTLNTLDRVLGDGTYHAMEVIRSHGEPWVGDGHHYKGGLKFTVPTLERWGPDDYLSRDADMFWSDLMLQAKSMVDGKDLELVVGQFLEKDLRQAFHIMCQSMRTDKQKAQLDEADIKSAFLHVAGIDMLDPIADAQSDLVTGGIRQASNETVLRYAMRFRRSALVAGNLPPAAQCACFVNGLNEHVRQSCKHPPEGGTWTDLNKCITYARRTADCPAKGVKLAAFTHYGRGRGRGRFRPQGRVYRNPGYYRGLEAADAARHADFAGGYGGGYGGGSYADHSNNSSGFAGQNRGGRGGRSGRGGGMQRGRGAQHQPPPQQQQQHTIRCWDCGVYGHCWGDSACQQPGARRFVPPKRPRLGGMRDVGAGGGGDAMME
jgi:hypothetical protein